MKTLDPDGKVHEWDSYAEWSDENGGTYTVSRPKDQDQNEPATPLGTQTWTMSWHGYTLTVKELRSWLNHLPDQATLTFPATDDDPNWIIRADWEVP